MHGPLPGIGKGTSNSDVQFRDGSGTFVNMNAGTNWLGSGQDRQK